MSEFACINARVLLENGNFVDDCTVVVSDGRISSVAVNGSTPEHMDMVDLGGNLLVPGFIDVQVNGGGGALFNDAPSVETIQTIANAHYQTGTTGFLPTLISDDLGKIGLAYRAVRDAMAQGVPGVLGIHVEGPFVNEQRKGIHDAEKIRVLDDASIEVVLRDRPEIAAMTIAPECVSPAHLKALSEAGILLFAGHSEATNSDMSAAFETGVAGVTHLFNAMSQLTGREPGLVGAALGNPDCWCCVIVDGVHVHPLTLQLAMKAKGSLDRFVLVTDAMPTVGQLEKQFILNGEIIVVRDGVCQNADGTLAGSDLDMASAVRNVTALLGLELGTAIKLASTNPAKMLGLDHRIGTIREGFDADMVEMSQDGTVLRTWIKGKPVWDRQVSLVSA